MIYPVGFLERTVNTPPPFSSSLYQRVPSERKHRKRLRYYSHSQQLCLRPSLTAWLYMLTISSLPRTPTKRARTIRKTSALRALVHCALRLWCRASPAPPTAATGAPRPQRKGAARKYDGTADHGNFPWWALPNSAKHISYVSLLSHLLYIVV